MQLTQLDSGIKILINYIPQIIILIAAIIVLRKYRSWLTIVLVVTAALSLVLPLAVIATTSAMNRRVAELQPEMQGMKTQQEVQQFLTNDPTIRDYNTLMSWLRQGLYFSEVILAVSLLLTLRFLMARAAAPAQPAESQPGTPPDATC